MRAHPTFIRAVGTAACFVLSGTAASSQTAGPNSNDQARTRGIALFDDGKYAEARAVLQPLATAGDPVAQLYLGRTLLRQNEADRATEWLERGVQKLDTSSMAHVWLAEAYGVRVQTANVLRKPFLARRAKSELDRAVVLDPRNIEAHAGLAQFYSQAPGAFGGSTDKARAEVRIIRGLNAYQGGLFAGGIELRAGNKAVAEREYRALMTAYPDSLGPRIQLARLFERDKRWDDALALFESELRRDPNDAMMLYQVGRLGAVSGQWLERSEQSLRRVLTLPVPAPFKSYAPAHYRLGMVLEKTERTAEALQEYDAAVRLDPTLKDARDAAAKLRRR